MPGGFIETQISNENTRSAAYDRAWPGRIHPGPGRSCAAWRWRGCGTGTTRGRWRSSWRSARRPCTGGSPGTRRTGWPGWRRRPGRGGTLRVAVAGTALGTGPLTVRNGNALQSDSAAGTVTINPSSIVNDGLIYAKTGTTDFSGKSIGATPSIGIQPISFFQERYFKQPATFTGANGEINSAFTAALVGGLVRFENADTFLSRTPAATNTLNTGTPLSFLENQFRDRGNAGTPANFYGTQNTRIGGAYVGTITIGGAIPAGVVSFGANSDDGSSLYIDANNDNVFQASELVVNNIFDQAPTARTGRVSLAAGTYKIAVGFFQGGGGFIEAPFAPGSGVPYTDQFVFNPGGSINAPGNIQVNTGASLLAGGFTAGTVTINGTGSLTITAAGTSSSALSLVNTDGGTINGGASATTHVLTVTSTLSIAAGQTLTKDGVGKLLVNGTGTGTLAVAAGTRRGSGSIAGPVAVASGARLAPGNSPPTGPATSPPAR